MMNKMNDFYNDGFGWICRHCERELRSAGSANERPHFYLEGEADIRQPRALLAKWADPARTTLVCPRCGITERVEIN